MARLRGRRLADLNRADMEALEQRVEARALTRWLDEHEPETGEEDR